MIPTGVNGRRVAFGPTLGAVYNGHTAAPHLADGLSFAPLINRLKGLEKFRRSIGYSGKAGHDLYSSGRTQVACSSVFSSSTLTQVS